MTMPDKETSTQTGYSQEDEHFKKAELEWLRKRRAELDADRQMRASDHTQAGEHWMKCPKCGGDLTEVTLENVMVDQCASCGGVYFDKGELEILIEARSGGGFLKKLFG
jgi:uncharacterized protein with PIN domain